MSKKSSGRTRPSAPKVKNPIPDTPMLKPPTPSKKFMAFCTKTIHPIVARNDTIGNVLSSKFVSRNGLLMKLIFTPRKKTRAAKIKCIIIRKPAGIGVRSSRKLKSPSPSNDGNKTRKSLSNNAIPKQSVRKIMPPGYGRALRFSPYRSGKSRRFSFGKNFVAKKVVMAAGSRPRRKMFSICLYNDKKIGNWK